LLIWAGFRIHEAATDLEELPPDSGTSLPPTKPRSFSCDMFIPGSAYTATGRWFGPGGFLDSSCDQADRRAYADASRFCAGFAAICSARTCPPGFSCVTDYIPQGPMMHYSGQWLYLGCASQIDVTCRCRCA
jgi:hypothetical protein